MDEELLQRISIQLTKCDLQKIRDSLAIYDQLDCSPDKLLDIGFKYVKPIKNIYVNKTNPKKTDQQLDEEAQKLYDECISGHPNITMSEPKKFGLTLRTELAYVK